MLLPLLAVTLTAAPAAPAAAPAATRLTFAFVPPGGADDDARALGLVLQTRATEVLRATGQFNELHAKQMLSMAGAEAFHPETFGTTGAADGDVAWYLGADVFLSGKLERGDKSLNFAGFSGVRGAPIATVKPAKMGATYVSGLNQAIGEITKQVATLSKQKVAKWPDLTVGTRSDEALLAYARCQATVLKQPMGIENPVVLNADAIGEAIKNCRAAIALDPKFTAAKVALALALAIEGSDAESATLLADAGEQDSALYWIARFWLVTRYQSPEAGEGLLRQAITRRPGFLLAQIYLCEGLTVLGQWEKAVKACEEVATVTPKGVFPLLRLGRALAGAGKTDDALKKSQEALALEPAGMKSREASLQLASRFIDANKLNDAISILEQLAAADNVRGEELLRLGYAYQLKGQADTARGLYEKAISRAVSPGEWRTRGRGWHDLAVIHAKAGAKDKAKNALIESRRSGFKPRTVDASLTALAKEVDADAKNKPGAQPREVTLLKADASGDWEVWPAGVPPQDFARVKF